MSRENLESLLDAMLEDGAMMMEAQAAREAEERARAQREREAQVEKPAAAPVLESVELLGGLPDGDLRKVLAKAPPDDLLVLLATSKDALQRRILGNLSADSVKWLRENLAHIESVNNAEREAAHKKVLKAANALLAAGEIELPEARDATDSADGDASDKDMRDALTDLVRIAGEAGPEALTEVAAALGEPLLVEGLGRILAGEHGDALRSALAAHRARLEAEYARRLRWMEDALAAIASGESAEQFRARLVE